GDLMGLSLTGVTLHVADVDKSVEFYKRFPGASVVFFLSGRFALLKIGSARLGILADQKRPFHVEIDCDDLDATHAKFTELGIPTEGPPTVRPWGERDFWVIDPDGNLVEVGQAR
ncbi:MAG: VOC family protein, partial [Tepidisphaeraceae bacterium]